MAEPYGKSCLENGFLADGALTQFAAVVMSTADNDVKISGTKGVFCPGIVQEAAADNAAATVRMVGISQAIVNESVAPGNELTVSAALGKLQKAVSTDWVCAIALQTAAADTDQVAVFLNGGYIKS
jgi:hypothetical protein